jgi:transcriptional regulator with PAS, ATPase and Fis domain
MVSRNLQGIKQRFGIIGDSPGLNYALSIAERVASTDLTVLINGESGVGKEVFSKIIHNLSARKHNPFIAVNCGAIPEGTIDSELFGHEKGAFTGAHDGRKGYFETVNGGTIFLDEIGEMPMGTQSRLLRVLEAGEFIRVGSSKVLKTDVRVIAATNVDLLDRVFNHKFREDLYYRLNTVPIYVPPLRDRAGDIHLLFRKFASDFAEKYRTTPIRLSEDAVDVLVKYRWPGNIRELKNVAEQISVMAQDKLITKEILIEFLPDHNKVSLPALYKNETTDLSERDIMYKLLFDMRSDLNDLKSFVLNMANIPEIPNRESSPVFEESKVMQLGDPVITHKEHIIINQPGFQNEELVHDDVSLSLADMEKVMIIKALKKHKGRRKDAALDLGISERTLYRKIKEYEINE